jgi:hypothetical protein
MFFEMTPTDLPAEYERIKAKLLGLGLVIPGTIRETYLQCGKKTCACAAKDGSPHGPYYFWNRKMDGRLTSKSLPRDKLSLYEGWISNRRKLEEIVQELLDFGSRFATDRPPENSKQRASPKRGT